MHLRLLETRHVERHPRRPRLDPWITLSAWMWTSYLVGMCAVILWWIS